MAPRPPAAELEHVGAEELVLRLVHPTSYNASAARIELSALPTKDFTPSSTSYGASAYVKSRLDGGISALYAAVDRWRTYTLTQVAASEIVALGIEVRYSPDDCQFQALKHAHASLIGITHGNRPSLLRLLERNIIAPP